MVLRYCKTSVSKSNLGNELVSVSKQQSLYRLSLSFDIVAVGRTGSGKSSLTLSLLRCILTEGKVYYDGIPTEDINLDALRSSITIIPQVVSMRFLVILKSIYDNQFVLSLNS